MSRKAGRAAALPSGRPVPEPGHFGARPCSVQESNARFGSSRCASETQSERFAGTPGRCRSSACPVFFLKAVPRLPQNSRMAETAAAMPKYWRSCSLIPSSVMSALAVIRANRNASRRSKIGCFPWPRFRGSNPPASCRRFIHTVAAGRHRTASPRRARNCPSQPQSQPFSSNPVNRLAPHLRPHSGCPERTRISADYGASLINIRHSDSELNENALFQLLQPYHQSGKIIGVRLRPTMVRATFNASNKSRTFQCRDVATGLPFSHAHPTGKRF